MNPCPKCGKKGTIGPDICRPQDTEFVKGLVERVRSWHELVLEQWDYKINDEEDISELVEMSCRMKDIIEKLVPTEEEEEGRT